MEVSGDKDTEMLQYCAHTHWRGEIFCEERDLRWESCETRSVVCPFPRDYFASDESWVLQYTANMQQ